MIKIIGIGSPFGNDQVGLKVAEKLKKRLENISISTGQLEVITSDRPGMGLLELMRGIETVYLIDAINAGFEAGTIREIKNDEIESTDGLLSSHGFGVAETLKLGKALEVLPKQIVLYGIEVGEVSGSFGMSSKINDAAQALADRLFEELVLRIQGSRGED